MGQQIADSARLPVRLLLGATAGIALATLLLRFRSPVPGPRHAELPAAIARVRAQLALGPVLAAEVALRRRPDDARIRLRLATACAGAGDPAGAALAIFPLVSPSARPRVSPSPELVAQYAGYCLQVGWLDETAAALRRLPGPSPRSWLDLAAAYAGHGQARKGAALLTALSGRDLPPDEGLDGAITAYHCRRLDLALQWARRAVAKAPANPATRAVLAHCLLASGQPDAALQVLSDHRITPNPLLDYWRARAEVRGADPARRKAGRERLARLVAATADAPAAFDAGRAFLLAGQPERAAPLLSRAAVSGYQEVLCYALLSRCYEALGRPADAHWALGRSLVFRGQYAEAVAALRRSLEGDATKPAVYLDLAWALSSHGDARQALAVLQRGEQVAPGSMDIRLLKARLLLHLERVPEVIRELTAAAALDPKRANEPLGNLGTVYYDSQQFDRAVPVLERAVQLESGDAHSQFYLGRIDARRLEEPGRADQAVDHLLRAARMQPDYSRPWMEAAAVLQRRGALPEAAACLRRAIDGECQSDAPYVRLAQILRLQGRLPECRLVLKEYAVFRDHDLTRTGLEKETRDNPQDAVRRYALGDLLLREGRPEQALPELLAAAGVRPQWQQAQARLADACALLGYDDLREEAERAPARGGSGR